MTKLQHNQTLKATVFFMVVFAVLMGSSSLGATGLLPEYNTSTLHLRENKPVSDDTNGFICPEDVSTYTDLNSCDALITSGLAISDPDNIIASLSWQMQGATQDQSPASGVNQLNSYVFNEGTTVVSYQGKDRYNNSIYCSFTVTVTDNQVPRLIYSPGNISVTNIPGECKAKVRWTEPIVTDNCAVESKIRVQSNHVSGETFPVGTTDVVYRISDGVNELIHRFSVIVKDAETPELIAPEPIVIVCGEEVEDAFTNWEQFEQAGGKASDNCAINFESFRYVSQSTSDIRCPYIITRVYSIADINGNVSTVKRYIQVTGEEPEEIQKDQENSRVILKSGMASYSTVKSGDWNDPTVWSGGAVPTSVDDVVISSGHVVSIDSTAICNDITITGTINYSVPDTLKVNGSWTNNGAFNPGTNGTVLFEGSGSAIISGTSSTAFKNFILDKESLTDVLQVNSTVILDGDIRFNSGLMQINSTGSVECTGGSGFTVEADAGLYVNGGSFIGGSFSVTFKGLFQIDSGTATFGGVSGNSILTQSSGTFDVNGGTVNVAGRLQISGGTAEISGAGTVVNLNKVGQNSSSIATLDVSSTASFTMTSGTINFLNPNGSGYYDVEILSSGSSISGSTFHFGDGSTDTYRISTAINIPTVTTTNNTDLEYRRLIASNGPYTFPLTDGSGNSIPVTVNVSGSSYSAAFIEVKTFDTAHPNNNNSQNYLDRYWTIEVGGVSGLSYSVTAPYSGDDIASSASNFIVGNYSSGWSEISGSSVAGNAVSFTSSSSNLSFTVLEEPTIEITNTDPEVICNGGSVTLNTSASGGSTLTYLWNVNPATTIPSGTSPTVSPPANPANSVTNYTYTVTVTDNNGITASDQIGVTVNPIPTVSATLVTQQICPGGTITTINISNPNSVSGATFSWTRNNTSVLTGIATSGSGNTISGTFNSTNPGVLETTTFTITASANGCSSQTTVDVVVGDVIAPVADVASLPDATGECSVTATAPTATDACAGSITGTTTDPLTYNSQGAYTITWTYDDGNGNTSTQTQTVIVDDTTDPVADVASLPDATGECSVTATAPTATDACAGSITGTTTDPLTYNSQGTYTITWTYDDGNGNTSTQTQTVIVDDTTAPVADVASLPDATGECSVTATAPTATDACAGSITGTTTDPLTYNSQGAYTITWTYDDGNGNTSTQTQTVIVDDTTDPVADVASLPDATGECSVTATAPTATDACAGSITGTTTDPLTYNSQGTYTITWTYDDGNGNTSTQTQTVIVDDTTAPVADVASLPDATGECSVTATAPTATDACAGSITGTTTDPLTYNSQGAYTITWTYDDGNGNTSTQTQTVIVDDTTDPVADVASLPDATGECSVTATAPTAADACAGSITGTTTDPLTYNSQGTYTITWTYDDGNGNTSTQTQTVIVDDTTDPVADVASLPDATGECSVTATAPTATDACAGNITGTTTDPLTYNSQGTYTITWTYDDGNGNTSTQTQTVIVDDTTDPVADVASLPDATGECSVTATAPTATDACAGSITGTTTDPLTYNSQGAYTITWTYDDGNGNTSTQTQTVIVDDTTDPVADVASLPDATGECSVTATAPTATDACAGSITGTTTDPLTYNSQGTYTITWTYDDGNGNTSTQTQTVIVDDTTAPVADVASLPDATGECSVTATAPTATDACAGSITGTTTDPLTYNSQGTYTITWTYDDGNGNTSTQTQTVIVDDTTAPVADVASLPDATGECSVTATAPTATDACAGSITGTTTDPLTYNSQGTYTITWTYDDGNGNTSTQTQTVIVDDTTAPVADVASLPDATGECSVTATAPTATDACAGSITGTTTDPLTYNSQGTYTITWTYDDGNGNTSTQTQTVIVDDTTAPVADVASLPDATGECSVTATAPTATDGCAGSITGTTTDPLTYNSQGTYTITWTYDDGNGNTSTQTQTVIVDDTTDPTIFCPGNLTANTSIGICGAVVTYSTPVGTDNCSGATTTQTAGLASGSTFPVGVTTNTFEVTDAAGNSNSCSFTVIVTDNRPPTLVLPSNIAIKCNDSADPGDTGSATATDNCGAVTITYTDNIADISANCANNYTIYRTWLAEDMHGNQSTDIQEIYVSDVTGPGVVFANQILPVSCPDDIPEYYEDVSQFLASHASNDTSDLCSGGITMEFYDEYSYFDNNSGNAGYCPDSVKRTYRFYDGCLNYTDVEQVIIVDDLSSCDCDECTDKVNVYDVDLRANPDSLWFRLKERKDKNSRCCLDDVWWEEGGNDPYRCVSFNVIIDDDAVGVQITTSKGQDSKEWRVDCENVSLEGPDGDIICLPSGEYHLFTHCKQGNDPIDYYIQSVRGIIESGDIATRVDCSRQIHTTGDFESDPVWSALNPLYDKYLDTSDPYNPIFLVPLEDKDIVPPTIQYQVCADLVGYICGQSSDGTICDTITVSVYDPIETIIELGDLIICEGDPAYVEPIITPAGDYIVEWFEGTGATGTLIHTGINHTLTTTGWYSVKVTEYESGLPCNVTTADFEIEVDLTRPGLNAPPDTLFLQCDDPDADQKIIDWYESAWAFSIDAYGDTVFIDVSNNYSGINLVCGEVLDVEFVAVDFCSNDSVDIATIVVEDNTAPVITPASDQVADCNTLDKNTHPDYLVWLANNGGATATDACEHADSLEWSNNAATQTWIGNGARDSITVTFTVTDDCDNSASTTAIFTIVDDVPPTLTCPDNVTEIAAANQCSKMPATLNDPTYSDDCSLVTLTWSSVGALDSSGTGTVAGVAFPVGLTTVTYRATDAANLFTECSFTVTIVDTVPPQIECDAISDVEEVLALDSCSKTPTALPEPDYRDNCWIRDSLTITYTITGATSGSGNGYVPANTVFATGVSTVTYVVTDPDDNSDICSFTVTIKSVTPPELNCGGVYDVAETLSADSCSKTTVLPPFPTITFTCWDEDSLTLAYTISGATTASGAGYVPVDFQFNPGVSTVTYIISDPDDNSASCPFTVTIEEVKPPEIDCGGVYDVAETLSADSCSKTTVLPPVPTITFTCWDEDSLILSYTITGATTASGTGNVPADFEFNPGVSTVTYIISDPDDNSASCPFNVTIESVKPPEIDCGGVYDVTETLSTDSCSKTAALPPVPEITFTCWDEDSLTLSYLIESEFGDWDTTGVGTVPADLEFPVGVNTVTYTISDPDGYSVSCAFTVTILHVEVPSQVYTCPANPNDETVDSVSCDAWITIAPPTIEDHCITANYTVTHDSPYGTDSTDASGYYPIGEHTITWTISDNSDNDTTCIQTFEVFDLLPALVCPPDVEVFADPNELFATNITVGLPYFWDNCDSVLTYTVTPPDSITTWFNSSADSINLLDYADTYNLGVTTIEYTFKDGNGNILVCDFTVTVYAAPDIECPPDTTIWLDGSEADCSVTFDPGVADLIEGAPPIDWTYTIHFADGTTEGPITYQKDASEPYANPLGDRTLPLGVTTIEWRAENQAGFDTCSHWIEVIDTIPPEFTVEPYENCVDPLHWALFNESNPNPVFNHVDPLVEKFPVDYRTLVAGDTYLDLTSLEDNCCDSADMTIHWRIEFSTTPNSVTGVAESHPNISGIGQPSTYVNPTTLVPSDIELWGDGVTFTTVMHHIFYWVEDCNGNTTDEVMREVTITPRPEVTKQNY